MSMGTSGLALASVYDVLAGEWVCVDGLHSLGHASARHRVPCVCEAPPPPLWRWKLALAAPIGMLLALLTVLLGYGADVLWRWQSLTIESGEAGRRFRRCVRRHGGRALMHWLRRAWRGSATVRCVRDSLHQSWQQHLQPLWINGRGADFVAVVTDVLPPSPQRLPPPTLHSRSPPSGASRRGVSSALPPGRRAGRGGGRATTPRKVPALSKALNSALSLASKSAELSAHPLSTDETAGVGDLSSESASEDEDEGEDELMLTPAAKAAAVAASAASPSAPLEPPPVLEASMGLLRRAQLLLFAVLLPLREVGSDGLLLHAAIGEHAWADAMLLAICLVFGGLCNGLAAAGELIPDTPGLNLSAGASCNEEEGSDVLREQQRRHRREPPSFQMGLYVVELPRRVVFLMGVAGLAMPLQAVHDAWQGVETINLVELRLRWSLLFSAPMLYAKVAIIATNGGPGLTLLTQPLLLESACLSALVATLGLAALWTSHTVAPDRRVYGGVLRRCIVIVSCFSFGLSDLALRALTIAVVAHSGVMVATVPSALLLVLLCWVAVFNVDRAAAGAHLRPRLGFALTAALQLLGPHAGGLVTPSFLALDACTSTLLNLLIILGATAVSLPSLAGELAELLRQGQKHPAHLPSPPNTALCTATEAISVAIGLAVYKLTLLIVSVWPLRVGGLAIGMRSNPYAIDEIDGLTALHHAAACGSPWFTWYCLQQQPTGVKDGRTRIDLRSVVDLVDRQGRTALLLACNAGHEQPVKLLLARGARLEHRDACGWTPLLYAGAKGHELLVRELLRRDAMLHHCDNRHATALLYACANGHESTASLLLESGACIESTDADGGTALQCACANGHGRTAEMLLNRGAALEHQDYEGRTALTWACASGHEAVGRMLLQRGANMEHLTLSGHSPLFRACANGHMSTVRGMHAASLACMLMTSDDV